MIRRRRPVPTWYYGAAAAVLFLLPLIMLALTPGKPQ